MARKRKNNWPDLGFPQRLTAVVAAAKTAGRIKSVSGLARTVGVSGSQVDRWRSGENDPTLGAVHGLGVRLEVYPWWLAFGDDASKTISDDRLYDKAIRAILEMMAGEGTTEPAKLDQSGKKLRAAASDDGSQREAG